MPHPTRRRTALLALLGAALLFPTASSQASSTRGAWLAPQSQLGARVALRPASARAAQETCANADAMPTDANEPAVREAILCLHNEIRAQRDLPALRQDFRLRRAALSHSSDMVSRRYFEHTTPAGVTMVDRILAARYTSRDVGWSLGENLAWGTGRLATPRSVMRAWMESPGHRANILKRSYREIGIGIVSGVPTSSSAGATYTADFGVVVRR
jgi:uncharacterized protein YkwD